MLDRWTPFATEGDGNCMFRAVSLAVFGTQIGLHHERLRLRACVEVGLQRPVYDKDDDGYHELLRQDTPVPSSFADLWRDLCTPGRSCCYVALLALSTVLQVRIHSFFPPLQSSFVSPLTVDIVGHDVTAHDVTVTAMSIAVM